MSLSQPTLRFPLPQEFPLTQGFSAAHPGLDFACPLGTPLLLDLQGKITRADYHENRDGSPGYGNHIQVLHPDGSLSLYAHLSAFGVKVGQYCQRGETIGSSGNSGNSTGPHLHYEYRPDGLHGVDPGPYFVALDLGEGALPQPLEDVQPGERVRLREGFAYVNLRPVASAAAGVPDLGDLPPGVSLPVIAVEGEWLMTGVYINSRYLRLCEQEVGE